MNNYELERDADMIVKKLKEKKMTGCDKNEMSKYAAQLLADHAKKYAETLSQEDKEEFYKKEDSEKAFEFLPPYTVFSILHLTGCLDNTGIEVNDDSIILNKK